MGMEKYVEREGKFRYRRKNPMLGTVNCRKNPITSEKFVVMNGKWSEKSDDVGKIRCWER